MACQERTLRDLPPPWQLAVPPTNRRRKSIEGKYLRKRPQYCHDTLVWQEWQGPRRGRIIVPVDRRREPIR